MAGDSATVGTVRCRGGCGRDLDPEDHPAGICRDCEATEYRKNAGGRDRW